jgi:hypothetical protein
MIAFERNNENNIEGERKEAKVRESSRGKERN